MLAGERNRRSDRLNQTVTFVVLFVFWLLLSGKFDLFHIALGLICCAIVSAVSHDLLFTKSGIQYKIDIFLRFCLYLPWLIYQIVLANLHVAYMVLFPKKIEPQIIRFKTGLKSDLSMVTLANSITLTPGTITMDIAGEEFVVHALSKKVADDLLTGDMERRVAGIYRETAAGTLGEGGR